MTVKETSSQRALRPTLIGAGLLAALGLGLARLDIVQRIVPELVNMSGRQTEAVVSRLGLIYDAAHATRSEQLPGLLVILADADPNEKVTRAKH